MKSSSTFWGAMLVPVMALLSSGCPAHLRHAQELRTALLDGAGPGATLPPDIDLLVVLELRLQPALNVGIALAFRGAPSGTTELLLSEHWGGVPAPGGEILRLQAAGSGDNPVAIEHPQPHRWTLRHAPDELLLVTYELAPSSSPLGFDSGADRSYHHPILQPELFHLIGTVGLLTPEHLTSAEDRGVELRWRGFAEAGWAVACSFGIQPEGLRLRMTLEEFRHGLFLAGKLRLVRRELSGGALVVSLAGTDWDFSDSEFAGLAAAILETERDFFGDRSQPFFLVSAIPIGPRQEGFTGISGTGLSQSFALFMSPGISLKPGSENAHRVKELLAHELLHNWTGGWITVDQPERLLYWFTEGFTNHYTRRLLYRAGQITLDEYLGFLNELTVGYMHSPVRDQPNEIIEKDFWSRGEVHELPYLRGDMLAIEVDWEIRRASHGKKSLDDFMRAALAQARALKRPLDNQALLELIGSFTSSEFVGRIQKQIWQGELVVLPATAYAPCLLLQTHPVGPFDIGFDFERGRASKVVSGVKRNSNAFASGLRDGQKLLGWEVHDQQPLKPARLTVMDGARRLDLSYLPQGPPIQVPLFSKQPAAEKTCRGIL